MGLYNVYPMGTTIYDPEKAWSGYTLMQCQGIGAVLVDMNGNVKKVWKDVQGFPNKLLPGGYLMGSLGLRDPKFGYQDQTDVVEVDWDGKVVWKFDKKELVDDDGDKRWIARQHHDYQREGNPVGYYVPGMEAKTESGNTLILCHEDVYNKKISEHRLLDDVFIEVDWEGNIVWEWHANKHFNELGFSEIAKNVLARNPNIHENGGGQSDWMHINSMSVLGPNKWYDAGDERFNPENIIWDAREANIMAIISKKTGKIVWKIGPDFTESKELRIIGQIIGQHHCHMIPKGLPGEGNILLFDNGGWAGYGMPSRCSRDGGKADLRDHSRVLEIDPTTLEVVWEFSGRTFGGMMGIVADSKFYSPLISSAQRLPNGNTLICEGCYMRMFEVTPDKEVVWEFIAPFKGMREMVYRAYRYPYDYVPQLEKPVETPVVRLDNHDFRVPGASDSKITEMTTVEGTLGYTAKIDACVTDGQV
ncbi:aryl-sulfate sulfotransferase [Brotaphodocola sp.]|uniref:aryl-sulfate sulfotransferase n=1 Tax=Brotaphodocola sp. TaxID=3073577 RepID=UPI003D7DE7BD